MVVSIYIDTCTVYVSMYINCGRKVLLTFFFYPTVITFLTIDNLGGKLQPQDCQSTFG